MSISINFPFAAATGSLGYLEPTSNVVDALTANIKSLLLTNWGERVMQPDFGCNFRQFIFEQKTTSLKSSVADRVRAQLDKWLPFLTLVGLYVKFSEEDKSIPENGFGVQLQLTYGNIPVNLFLTFPS